MASTMTRAARGLALWSWRQSSTQRSRPSRSAGELSLCTRISAMQSRTASAASSNGRPTRNSVHARRLRALLPAPGGPSRKMIGLGTASADGRTVGAFLRSVRHESGRRSSVEANASWSAVRGGRGARNGPFPGQTKCREYASSSFLSLVLVNRRRCFGPLPQRMYAVADGTKFRSCAWNRRIRSRRDNRVRLPWMTLSKYGTRPKRQSSSAFGSSTPIATSTSTGATTVPPASSTPTARTTRG